MKYSVTTLFLAALSSVAVPGVLADEHYECSCSTWDGFAWVYNWQLTFNACVNNYSGEANYNHGLGRCKWFSHKRVQGGDWNKVCQQQASEGYYPVVNNAIDTTQEIVQNKKGHGFCKK
ncbi:hypothetical protein FOMA001_g18921 [Fusarium oxysporum f. sp. matthiolae]|nr:hypothetical protein FOMA001_g18921 [Fusarium oxysporum f. sp. matthiolae]